MQKEALPMSSTDERISALYVEHLAPDGEPNFDAGLDDTGVSSVDAVAFIKKVGEAFNVTIPPEDVSKFRCLRDLATYLESHAG